MKKNIFLALCFFCLSFFVNASPLDDVESQKNDLFLKIEKMLQELESGDIDSTNDYVGFDEQEILNNASLHDEWFITIDEVKNEKISNVKKWVENQEGELVEKIESLPISELLSDINKLEKKLVDIGTSLRNVPSNAEQGDFIFEFAKDADNLQVLLSYILPGFNFEYSGEIKEDQNLSERLEEKLTGVVLGEETPYTPFTKEEVRELSTNDQTETNSMRVEYRFEDGSQVEYVVFVDENNVEFFSMPMDEFVAQLNALEAELAPLGASLRKEGSEFLENVFEYAKNPDLFKQQIINAVALSLKEEGEEKLKGYLNDYLDETELPGCPQINPQDVYQKIPGLGADSYIQTPTGEVMKASEYIKFINNTSKVLCMVAAPFLLEGDFFSMGEDGWLNIPDGMTKNDFLDKIYDLLKSALENLESSPGNYIPSSFVESELFDDVMDRLRDATERLAEATAEALASAVKKVVETLPEDLKIPKIPSIPAVAPQPNLNLELKKRKTWPGFNIGNRDIVAAQADAFYELRGTETEQRGEAYGRAVAYLISRQLNVLSGDAYYHVGPSNLEVQVEYKILAKDIVRMRADLNDGDGSNLQYQYSTANLPPQDHPLRYGLKYGASYHFAVGPIPVNVELGISGNLQLDYEVAMNPVMLHGGLTPSTNLNGYADGSAGWKGVLEAGAGAELKFIEFSAPLTGDVMLKFDDIGRPYVSMDIVANTGVRALDGRIYAYARYLVPRWGIPPWKKRTSRSTIYRWTGLKYEKRIFNWGMEYGRRGVRMRGDIIDQNDVEHEHALQEALELHEREQRLTDYENDVNTRVYDIVNNMALDIFESYQNADFGKADALATVYVLNNRQAMSNNIDQFSDLGVSYHEDRVRDSDQDGLTDIEEGHLGTDPLFADSDSDGLPDGYETRNGLNPSDGNDSEIDSDGDGFTNYEEFVAGSDPNSAKSTPETVKLSSWLIPILSGMLLN